MDPNFITDQQWIQYRDLVSFLWLFPLLTFLFATCLLLFFAILPSLRASAGEETDRSDRMWAAVHQAVGRAAGLRPLLLVAAAAALAGLVAVFLATRDLARVIEETYLKWWI